MSDKTGNPSTNQDPVEFFFAKQWSDGLPVVPPTEEKLSAMLAGTRRDPEELIGLVPPLMSPATVRAIALHAVMAGCKPEYMPVVIGALECVLEERFNLLLLQATTSAGAPFVLVNGPYAREIGLHGGMGCFGPGFRANATIGRALRGHDDPMEAVAAIPERLLQRACCSIYGVEGAMRAEMRGEDRVRFLLREGIFPFDDKPFDFKYRRAGGRCHLAPAG